ncbi:MAG: hypothetical protein ACRD0G_06230 [Acidimicrobiales bacterium]
MLDVLLADSVLVGAAEHSPNDIELALAIFAVIVLTMWLLPSLVATYRRVANAGSIVVLNVLLSWIPLIWVLCLALACQSARPRARRVPSATERPAPWPTQPPRPAPPPRSSGW